MNDLGGDEEGDETGGAPENPEDYLKIIQTKTGKLTQKLDIYKDKLKSEDIKYVIGMVLGTLDLHKLEEPDKEEILKKFEDEKEGEEGGLNPENAGQNPEEGPNFEATEMQNPENEQLGELDRVDNDDELRNGLSLQYHNEDEDKELEELINTPFEFGDEDTYDPDEEDIEPLDLGKDAGKAGRFAKKDIESDNPDRENVFNIEFAKARDDKKKSEEECLGGELTEEDPTIANNVRELDINELQNAVASGVKETLSKYFEQ